MMARDAVPLRARVPTETELERAFDAIRDETRPYRMTPQQLADLLELATPPAVRR